MSHGGTPTPEPPERVGRRPELVAIGLGLGAAVVLPLAVLVRDRWSPLAQLDSSVEAGAHRAVVAHEWLRVLALVVTWAGAPVVIEVATALLCLELLQRLRRRTAGYLACCVVGAYALSTTGKLAVGRARPAFPDPVSQASGASFPSGHATGAAAFYLAVAVVLAGRSPRRRPLLTIAVLVPLAVAATRVLLGVHYLTDVVAGLVIGWGWTIACTALFSAWRADEEPPAPVLESGVEPEDEA